MLRFMGKRLILRVRVVKINRESNKFVANISPNSPNQAILSFDYLDAGDGAFIELLHTNETLHEFWWQY